MDEKKIIKFNKKANKKNKVKKIKDNYVLLLKKNELSDYSHLKNNLSDLLYQKEEVDLNTISNKELLKKVIKAKYIFIDEYDPRLSGFNFQEQETIYLGTKCGFFKEELNKEVSEFELEFFSKMKYIVVGSSLMKNYYQQLYNVDKEQFLELGFYQNDKYYAKKWELASQKISDGYVDLLYKFNIYFIPKDFGEDISEYLNYLNDNLDDQFNIFYTSHNFYDIEAMKVQRVYDEDIRFMCNNVNVIITNKNDLVFEMKRINNSIAVINDLSDLESIVNKLKQDIYTFSNEKVNQDWYEYDTGVCCRSIVTSIMKLS